MMSDVLTEMCVLGGCAAHRAITDECKPGPRLSAAGRYRCRRKENIMSQKREKRKRRERRREYALELRCWQHNEPPKILFWRWRKWYRSKPTLKDGGHWSVKGMGRYLE